MKKISVSFDEDIWADEFLKEQLIGWRIYNFAVSQSEDGIITISYPFDCRNGAEWELKMLSNDYPHGFNWKAA